MSDQSLNRPSSSVVLAALVVLTGTGFFVVDRIPAQLGGLGQLWILAIVVGAGGSAAAWALARGRFAGGASGSLAIVLLAYLAIHAMLVGVGYLAAVGWAKLALPVALFVTAVLDEPARRRSVVVQALTAVTLLSALAAFGELVDPAPMPRSWVDPSRYQAVRVRVTAMFDNPNVYGA
ncbi:MAG: hypothetical protein HY815_24335, partial [Candidatus Riflebacteria bacterium]|nr:hypothetical protein [Candidatus Riflebacteria bacterium]